MSLNEEKGIKKIKLLMMVVSLGFLLGAKVQLSTAETVARSIYLEHANLHNGNEFIISNVETIKNEELDLIYIFHLDQKGFIMVPADDQAVAESCIWV